MRIVTQQKQENTENWSTKALHSLWQYSGASQTLAVPESPRIPTENTEAQAWSMASASISTFLSGSDKCETLKNYKIHEDTGGRRRGGVNTDDSDLNVTL